MELTDKTAIITGVSGQLGQAIAAALARRGMDCVCHYHTHDKVMASVVQTIEQAGRRALTVRADLADPAAPETIVAKAAELGPVRVLINSASVFERHPVGTYSHDDVSKLLAINVTAPLLLCGAFANYLKEQRSDAEQPLAAIINMTDVAAVKPWAQFSPYCAGRAAMVAATKSLAKELAPGITVNAIAPGIVTWPGKMDPSDEDRQLKMIPARRFGDPEDITRTINFLLDTPYVTGQVLCVDGGRSL